MKSCPYCMWEIPNAAKKCKFCWEWVIDNKNPFRNGNEVEEVKGEGEALEDDFDDFDEIDDEDEDQENDDENSLWDEEDLDGELLNKPTYPKKNNVTVWRWSRFLARFSDFLLMYTVVWWFVNYYLAITKRATIWNYIVWIKFISSNDKYNSSCRYLLRFLFYAPIPISLFLYFARISKYFNLNESANILLWLVAIVFWIVNIIELFWSNETYIDKLAKVKRTKCRSIQWWWIALIFVLFLISWIIQNYINSQNDRDIDWYDSNYSDIYSEVFSDSDNDIISKMMDIQDKYETDNFEIEIDDKDLMNINLVNNVIFDLKQLRNNLDKILSELNDLYRSLSSSKKYQKYSEWEILDKTINLYDVRYDYVNARLSRLIFLTTIQNELKYEDWVIIFKDDASEWSMDRYNELVNSENEVRQNFVDLFEEMEEYAEEYDNYNDL